MASYFGAPFHGFDAGNFTVSRTSTRKPLTVSVSVTGVGPNTRIASGSHANPARQPVPPFARSSWGSIHANRQADSSPPVPAFPPTINPTTSSFACDTCNADITHRPRMHCLECRDFDVCSHCYVAKRVSQSHKIWHKQQTILPFSSPEKKIPNPSAKFECSICCADISSEPRVRCLECDEYDQCLDCNLMGASATNLEHGHKHKTNVIISHFEGASRLIAEDGTPSELYERLIDSVFTYIDETFPPQNSGMLEPAKLSAFYNKIGMSDDNNIGLFPSNKISSLYSTMACQYCLISSRHHDILARVTPWSIDELDSSPTTPALTRVGWIRFFVICSWMTPGIMHSVLEKTISSGVLWDAKSKEHWRISLPRESFPMEPLEIGDTFKNQINREAHGQLYAQGTV